MRVNDPVTRILGVSERILIISIRLSPKDLNIAFS
jgi:hypothetical protein